MLRKPPHSVNEAEALKIEMMITYHPIKTIFYDFLNTFTFYKLLIYISLYTRTLRITTVKCFLQFNIPQLKSTVSRAAENRHFT